MKSGSTVLNTHVPCGAAYITPDGTDTNIAERFLAKAKRLREMLKYKVPIKWTVEEKEAFQDTQRIHTCHICKRTIYSVEKKVADHDHLTGRFRGPAHNKCNLDYGFKPEKVQIPFFLHNLKHYDAQPRRGMEKSRLYQAKRKTTYYFLGQFNCQFGTGKTSEH